MLLDEQAVSGADAIVKFEDRPGAAQHRYRIELVDGMSNQRIVITSHFYVMGVAASAGGCATGGSPHGWLAAARRGAVRGAGARRAGGGVIKRIRRPIGRVSCRPIRRV